MKETNETVNWFPEHFKHGRFEKSLENAPDWNISRNRYWGSPVPVWECECGERFVPGSIAELEERAGVKITTLHKPEIDDVEVTCDKCGKKVKRVPEVLDSWIEAGSASFAERHYPFEGDAKIEDFFPPDFIAEYTGQIRAWFYVLHVIGAALYKAPAFKNVVVEGVILGTDGRKMSKNLKNYPDPKELLSKYGGDGLRLYLLGSPVMHGEDIIISEEEYRNQLRGTLLILWNVYNFFVTYAGIDGWSAENKSKVVSTNVLDEWILALLSQLTSDVTSAFDGFDSVSAIGKINNFINDLSTWYLRRSRDRVGPAADNKEDKEAFYQTMYAVLTKLCVLMAPITPFVTEEIYRNLTGEQSVHLADWPHGEPVAGGEKLIEEMEQVRKIVEVGLSQRKEKQLKVRQPLSKFSIFNSQFSISDGLIQLIKDELNVKEVLLETGERELTGEFDTTITPELKAEGEARDIVRQIQEERKKLGTKMDEMVDVTIEKIPEGFEEYIKRHALVRSLTLSDSFTVTR
jgi:isoleucyl-tRNA synthetase